jgi:very-short-patch-repair endonuclease
VKPNRTEIESFKTNLITLLDRINDRESEEFHKNLVIDFLKKTYYEPNHFINTKGRNDLVIHNGDKAKSPVGVIIEAKKPINKSEMVTAENLNAKAFQELVLYYLRERITHKNIEVKHLVATNINEWFIFDATIFDRLFAQNLSFVKQFTDFENGRLADTKTDFFYHQIAEPYIEQIKHEIVYTYFNIQDYQKPLRNSDKADDNLLIALFKLLSPEHLLKLPFINDSNSLDKRFYTELLHIIGLTETKQGSKKLIERNKEGERNTGSILEDAIIQLDSLDKLSRLDKASHFGNSTKEQLFNVALELTITWINRILFLKLLEAQLITYHKGDKSYSFLNIDKIKSYDDLNSLFFQVLARKFEERNEDVKKVFEKVPYLNSSLFEPTDIEQLTLFISNLKDDKKIPIISTTVLKNDQGKKRTGNLNTLEYLFEFLNAYDFSSEGSEEIQEDNKTLINASVLGLIFEKINGYKDGSFFTPGFITMYMCRETIRKAVVQKFNEYAKKSPLERGFRGVSKGSGGVSGFESVSKGTESVPTGTKAVSTRSGAVTKRREIIPYNPKLKEFARELRNKSTKSEIILWNILKGKFEGKYDFHRQKPLDNYIADFFCYELKLVIEIDGVTHNWEETQKKDFEKELRFNELGLNVLRFPDSDIFQHLESTVETIKQYISGFENGDLSQLIYEDTPLNPLTGAVVEGNTPLNPVSSGEGDIPLNPVSRGDFVTPLNPVSGGEGNTPLNPVSSGEGDTPLNPLSRGDFGRAVSRGDYFESLDDVYEQIGDGRLFSRKQANEIINSIKICDPAVGSGHFLVSALNEMIAVKNDLKILEDREGKSLHHYEVEVVNDELIVTDVNGELFEYNPNNKESQRVQETLFHEKQNIIENCLFGVDINSNSVKICRLRLWIELLKNAYYKLPPITPLSRGAGGVLETLPNIDINIKCGNSLVSRFAIDADLKQALKKSKWTIDSYRLAVSTYRNAQNKEQKREMEKLIANIKSDFRSEIANNDPKVIKLRKLHGELLTLTTQQNLFEMSKQEKAEWDKKVKLHTEEALKLEAEIDEIKANKIYENAFEWRFEFPEVLNEDGDFVGFDVVIGNPPYYSISTDGTLSQISNIYKTFSPTGDIYSLFIELSQNIISNNSICTLIISNKWMRANYGQILREFIVNNTNPIDIIDFGQNLIFDSAIVHTNIISLQKSENKNQLKGVRFPDNYFNITNQNFRQFIEQNTVLNLPVNDDIWNVIPNSLNTIKLKAESIGKLLKNWDIKINFGIKTGLNEAFIIDNKTKDRIIAEDKNSAKFIKPILRGRDTRKYYAEFKGFWLINIPKGYTIKSNLGYPNIVMEPSPRYGNMEFETAWDYFKKNNRSIAEYLTPFRTKAEKREDKGDFWWELRACSYIGEFEKPKIIFSEIVSEPQFYYDEDGFYPEATVFFISGDNLRYLTAMLNSKAVTFLFKSFYMGGELVGKIRYKKAFLENVPIPVPNKETEIIIDNLVNVILSTKKQDPAADTHDLENQIDQLVYKLYDLTDEEIQIVEGKDGTK